MRTTVTVSRISAPELAAHTEAKHTAGMQLSNSIESRLANFHSAAEQHKQASREALDVVKGIESRRTPSQSFPVNLWNAVSGRRNARFN